MKILMIAQRLPYPPDKGEKIRSFHELRYLAERHDVWCACLIDDPADWRHVDELRRWCRDVAAFPVRRTSGMLRGAVRLLSGGTFTEGYFSSRPLAQAIARWSKQVGFDAVLSFSSSIARYGLTVVARRRVVDLCDVDSAKWAAYAKRRRPPARWILNAEAKRLARRERDLVAAYDAATVITAAEVERLEQADQTTDAKACETDRTNVTVIRNGIDLETFNPGTGSATEPIVGFVGTMDYLPNVEGVCWFVQRVWPGILHAWADARFLIVGRSPTRRVRALGHVRSIEVTGTVPSTLAYLQRMQVCVIPLEMVHGLANKVLEAMACGKPVVTTSAVAASLGAERDRDLLVADEPKRFAQHVEALLGDAERRAVLGRAARAFVESAYRWPDQLVKLERLLCGELDNLK